MLLNHFFDEFNNLYFANKSIQTIILIIQEALKSKMSNLANYSPYNKTYKFIMFQNQAYH